MSNETPVLDPSALDALRDILDDSDLAEIIHEYRDFSRQTLIQLNRAAERRDTYGIAMLSHSLKSSSHQLGAMRVGEECRRLEQSCIDNDAINLEQKIDRISKELEEVLERLGG